MKTHLLATVGNRDVQVTDRTVLPEPMRAVWTPARVEGEALLADLDAAGGALDYPMITPVVRWLLDEKGVAPEDLQVVLFATDQPKPFTPEDEWKKDTLAYAKIIRRALLDGLPGLDRAQDRRLTKRQVYVRSIETNPAHYRLMLDTFTGAFADLQRYIGPDDRVYLEVTGGTPAMTSMMIVAGADAFGERARCIYKNPAETEPQEVGILPRFFARQARAALEQQLKLHAYTAALATFERHRDLIAESVPGQTLVAALITYAERRLAFDFDRARQALKDAAAVAPSDIHAQLGHLQRQLQSASTADLLAELVHNARIKYTMGHYADFTQRLFRFQEAGFRYLAEKMGLQYKNPEGKRARTAWLRNVPGLLDYLASYTDPNGETYTPVNIIDYNLNRTNLGALVNFFVDNEPTWADRREVMDGLYRLSSFGSLRNKGLAGHSFQGIGKPDLTAAFEEDADHIVPLLETIYTGLFGVDLPEDPYAAANALIRAQLDR